MFNETFIYYVVFPLLSIILIGILFGERNAIQKNQSPWFQWNWFKTRYPKFSRWWVSNNWQYNNKTIQWLMRYPFSFLKDGTHWLESSIVFLIAVIIATYIPLVPSYAMLEHYRIELVVGIYVVIGSSFNYSYHK